jgi:hypothetical protein
MALRRYNYIDIPSIEDWNVSHTMLTVWVWILDSEYFSLSQMTQLMSVMFRIYPSYTGGLLPKQHNGGVDKNNTVACQDNGYRHNSEL